MSHALYVYLHKWNLQLYSVAKFHKTIISLNKESVAYFCKKQIHWYLYISMLRTIA